MTSNTLSRLPFALLPLAILLACAPGCSRSSAVPVTRASSPPTVVEVTEAGAATHHVGGDDLDGGADATVVTARTSPREDTFDTVSGVDAWVKALPRAKTYLTLDLAAGPPAASSLAITWRIHPSRTLQKLPPDQDYAGNHPSKLELVLARGAAVRRLPLGEHGGSPESLGLTHCRRLGYTLAPGDTPDADVAWGIPPLPNVVSTFTMATMQGSTDFMLVLGHDVLHVVHRFTHDGACPITVKQGPLSTCADMKWQLFADIRVAGEPRARESVVELDSAGTATPFDCKHSYSGEQLVAP